MATQINFNQDAEFHAEVSDLRELGWNFDFEPDSDESNYHIIIGYWGKSGKFLMRIVNSQKLIGGIDEGSDWENAGDPSMIKEDLLRLNQEGKLIKIDQSVRWQ